jgi:beta-glucuronidase
VDLDGIWDFVFSTDADYDHPDLTALDFADKIAVPGVWDAMPAWLGLRGTGFFRRKIEVPVGCRALIRVGALGMYGKIIVDGKVLGELDSPYVPIEAELPFSTDSSRELIVMACNRFDYKRCPMFEMFFDFYAYGGIFRHVEMQILPDGIPLDWVGVDTLAWSTRLIRVTVDSAVGEREIALLNAAGEVLLREKRTFATGRETFELTWPKHSPWTPESPVLNLITVDSGNDSVTVRFGIRQVRAADGKIFLNDSPLPKLLGYCRHEAHPQYGPALPLAQLIADIQLLRDLGCNFVRGSHYPQDPRFLDLCDEYGLLVWEESLGWGQKARHFTDPVFVDVQLRHTSGMIRASYNHPSVIMRGFLNEGDSTVEEARHCYESLINLTRKEDPSRLVTYATMFNLKDLFLEQVDVISFNTYPGWYSPNQEDENPLGEIQPCLRGFVDGLKNRGLANKPFIISEIGAGAIYGWRDPICAQWSEEYQAEYLRLACEEVIGNPSIYGVALWQFCDGRTYRGSRTLGRPRAFNNKGTLDEYRRPKMAYETVKKLFTEVKK